MLQPIKGHSELFLTYPNKMTCSKSNFSQANSLE